MKKILVLGGAHIDRRGMIETETAPGASNRTGFAGVGPTVSAVTESAFTLRPA